MSRSEYQKWVVHFLDELYKSDLQSKDLTVQSLFHGCNVVMTAEIRAKANGKIAGLEELQVYWKSKGIMVKNHVEDGDTIRRNQVVVSLSGPIQKLLQLERIGLDVLGRMSGIATYTSRLARLSPVPIAATRKTLWGLLDKKAVSVGGGLTHRLGLWQAIMIKDNHLVGLKNLRVNDVYNNALARAIDASKYVEFIEFIEIEVESPKEALAVISRQSMPNQLPFAVLLDNFSTSQIKMTIQHLEKMRLRHNVFLEASGGIHEHNLAKYGKSKVDFISLGALTHSPPMFDFSERILEQRER